MDNELTVFGTPAQDTPFATPISTPRRVPYRMNPVKMIRQHVPVKVLSTEEERIASSDSGSEFVKTCINFDFIPRMKQKTVSFVNF